MFTPGIPHSGGQKKPPLPVRGLGGNSGPTRQTASCTARTTAVKSATLSYHFYFSRQAFQGPKAVGCPDTCARCDAISEQTKCRLTTLHSFARLSPRSSDFRCVPRLEHGCAAAYSSLGNVGVHDSCQLDSVRESLPATAFHSIQRAQPAHLLAAHHSGSRRDWPGADVACPGSAGHPDAVPEPSPISHAPAVADCHSPAITDRHSPAVTDLDPDGHAAAVADRGSDAHSGCARLGSSVATDPVVERS